ncbi:MAG: DUF488 domain-containing protein [Gammaproteobacteria bacterium]|nr:DUF488 domain-containing protein [Gammaproteobacteria bacterium]MDP2348207.1 DUF488 domain-containing protein [Gammaproteobacteria bacterium]
MTIYTIGYEGLNIETFLALLKKQAIDTIVDVREFPLSRKPGFSKKALASHAESSGIEYVHLVKLGCPKPVRDTYRIDGDWATYTKGFMKHLRGQNATLKELSTLATTSNCALLCYEADYNFCHRSMVAHAASEMCGAQVKHIQANDIKTVTSASLPLAAA